MSGFPGRPDSKKSACNAGDLGLIPWRREWQPTPVFVPGQEFLPGIGQNSMDRGAWQATVHGVSKSRT